MVRRQLNKSPSQRFTKISVKASGRWITKRVWISIAKNYIYLVYGTRRAYWVLSRIPPAKRPSIKFIPKTYTLCINTYRVRFQLRRNFLFAILCLASPAVARRLCMSTPRLKAPPRRKTLAPKAPPRRKTLASKAPPRKPPRRKASVHK